MIRSMTGFASAQGAHAPHSWGWELRSVNGKGLDLRIRVPDWIDGLEAGVRTQIAAGARRGNITCNLRLQRAETGGSMAVNAGQLETVLSALQQIEARAMDAGISLAPSKATDIVIMRGVLEQNVEADDATAVAAVLLGEFPQVLAEFDAMRCREGAALAQVLSAQLDEISQLTAQAAALATQRQSKMAQTLRQNLAQVLEAAVGAKGADADRVAQELALIAVRADITEELDRLRAHVGAARDLLDEGGAVGRKLDFLTQEFNREANTLCAKAQHSGLTAVGLALKAVIDQMREQVQNVE